MSLVGNAVRGGVSLDTVAERAFICVVRPDAGGWGGSSGSDSGELMSRLGPVSFPVPVVCRDGANDGGAGVGEAGMATEAMDDLSVPCRAVGRSVGDGKDWMTLMRAWLVRMAALWIMVTSCARLGRMARMSRGVKGIMTSCAMWRNSVNHLNAVDCWISSSMI